jgi:HNH endonuclease
VKKLSVRTLREFFNYDLDEGILYWKPRARKWFKSDRDWKAWNTLYSNKAANHRQSSGYISVRILGKAYRVHRVVMAMSNARWPKLVDHMDGNKSNNRLSNLREATHSINLRNSKFYINNSSGYKGVSPKGNKWRVKIGSILLGEFSRKEDAIAARKKAEKLHGYS